MRRAPAVWSKSESFSSSPGLQIGRPPRRSLQRLLRSAHQQPPTVPVPIGGEALGGVVAPPEGEELTESGVAGLYLPRRRPAVVGQVVAAALRDRQVDQAAERAAGAGEAGIGVLHAQV